LPTAMEGEGRGFTGISISACGVQSGNTRVSNFTEPETSSVSPAY